MRYLLLTLTLLATAALGHLATATSGQPGAAALGQSTSANLNQTESAAPVQPMPLGQPTTDHQSWPMTAALSQSASASPNQPAIAVLGQPASAAKPVPLLAGDGQQAEFLPMEQAYRVALDIVGDRQLRLYWQIEEGYYLYRQRFDFQLTDADGPIDLETQFPTGVTQEDEYFGVSEVYYHFADIYANLARDTDRATLAIQSQGCADAGLCYPPRRQAFVVNFAEGSIGPAPGTGPDADFRPVARPMPISADITRTRDSLDATGRIDPTPASPPQTGSNTSAPRHADGTTPSLWWILLLAFVGGSILNLMPCVFPVLSLKVLNLSSGDEHSGHIHGWFYAFGIMVCFVSAALLMLGLQGAGTVIGWGFQMQSYYTVAMLAYLFFVLGLALSGFLEIGAGFMGIGNWLIGRGGYSDSFCTGVLAAVVASPCTAPFMGTALGFAITQPTLVALSVFAALGAGFAAPLLLLSYSRTLRQLLPKPGAWMETFKQVLAFPLYATAIWLLWVIGRLTDVTTMAMVLLGMLLLVTSFWLWRHRTIGKVLSAIALLSALAIMLSPMLKPEADNRAAYHLWNTATGRTTNKTADQANNPSQTGTASSHRSEMNSPTAGASQTANQIADQAASQTASPAQRVARLLEGGRPLLVNVTADWCITCLVNERVALNSDAVQQAMSRQGIGYLAVDWTHYNPEVAGFLAQFNRNGVPLYLLYSGRSGEPPLVLPQILTPGIVLAAFDKNR